MNNSREHLKDEGSRLQAILAGAIAGLTTRFVIAPLDVVKIRLQLQTQPLPNPISQQIQHQSSPVYKGAFLTFRHLIQNEGITSLWKGNIPAELMYLSYSSIQFAMYRTITLALQQSLGDYQVTTFTESFIAGACAGAISTTATYPLDLLRTRLAAQGTEKIYRNLAHSIRDIYSSEGCSGFFRGVGAGVGQIIPYMGIFFSTYETLRLPLGTLNLPFGSRDASAGIIASLVAKTSVFPFDLIRKKLQVQGPTRSRYVYKDIPVYKGTFETFQKIMKSEGLKGLYRGLTVSLLKAAPSGAVTMWTYESALHILMKMDAATVV